MAAVKLQTEYPTSLEDWARSDAYHNSHLIGKDVIMDAVVSNNHQNGLPDIAVSEAQGKYLKLLVRSLGAKRILEVGTLGGYSTIWLARGIPDDGSIVTLELSEKYAKVAQENIANAGFANKIKVILGPAVESLAALDPEVPFDFIFIDADKPSNLAYFTQAKRLVKKGGVIIVDNVMWYGRVANPNAHDDNIEGVRNLLRAMKDDPEVDATTMGTAGEKGYDGFLYAVRN